MQARTDPPPRREFATAADADAVIDSVLGRFERHLRVPAGGWVHEEPFVLRHRIIMDRLRFESVTSFAAPEPTELDYFVTLDFRFVRGAEHYQRWHLSIAVWSELPFGVEHRPPLDDRYRGASARPTRRCCAGGHGTIATCSRRLPGTPRTGWRAAATSTAG